jgi:hypothetical protein
LAIQAHQADRAGPRRRHIRELGPLGRRRARLLVRLTGETVNGHANQPQAGRNAVRLARRVRRSASGISRTERGGGTLGNRKKAKTQGGRKLKRYKRRRKFESQAKSRSSFRRLVVRYEGRAENYLGFVHLGCIILLKHVGDEF